MAVIKSNQGSAFFTPSMLTICLVLIAAFCCLAQVQVWAQTSPPGTAESKPGTGAPGKTLKGDDTIASTMSPEERIEQIEKTVQSIKRTGEMAEVRSYQNKMMARELIGYVKIVVVVLIIIAVVFPLTIWLMSRRRILGLSGLSAEVATTLLAVEERQAKLANILKEIQGEIDYLHTMSVPDLKNLIQQAEKYLKQNEQDLDKAGFRKSGSEGH